MTIDMTSCVADPDPLGSALICRIRPMVFTENVHQSIKKIVIVHIGG